MKHPYRFLFSGVIGVGLAGLGFSQPAAAVTTVDLSTIPEAIEGTASGERVGWQLAAGDVNGDGFGDTVIGASNSTSSTDFAYLVYGGADTFSTAAIDLTAAPTFQGATGEGNTGLIVGVAGDVNNDGYDDLLFGDSFVNSATGVAYLVYGQAAEFTGDNALSSVGVAFTGEATANYAGVAVTGVGDVNSDGYDDFVITAYWNDSKTGAAYLYYGKPADFSDETLGTSGITFTGEAINNLFGSSVAGMGDLNADGYDDFAISASQIDTYTGAVYLFYGQAATFTDGPALTRSTAKISGEETYDSIGQTMGLGDFDGDGYDDLLIGSQEESIGDAVEHGSYLIYGGVSALADMNASAADAKFTVTSAGDSVTYYVAAPGDLNGDGIEDFTIGVPSKEVDAITPGVGYLFYGSATRFAGSFGATEASREVATAFSTADLGFVGEKDSDGAGEAFAGADVNGDGFTDLVLGASAYVNADTDQTGAAYVIFFQVDADGDSVTGTDGLIDGTDCNDSDSAVSENQTYWADGDGDGLGDPLGATTSLCSATAPDGFADNDEDTNDAIQNNGVEITGDAVDNDNDGEVDEVNTLAENGAHPEYSTYSARSAADATAAVTWVRNAKKGRIKVRYEDDSIYRYRIFPNFNGDKRTKVRQFREHARYSVLHPRGKKLAFVNVLNGSVRDRTRLAETPYRKNSLKHFQFHDKWVAVITSKLADNVQLSTVRVKGRRSAFGAKDQVALLDETVVPKKTIKKRSRLLLRDRNGTVIARFRVSENFTLEPLP